MKKTPKSKSRDGSLSSGSISTSEQYIYQSPRSKTASDDSAYQYSEPDYFAVEFLEREENLRYGWGKFTPDWLQWCCTPQFLLASLMFIAVCQGIFVHGLIASSWGALQGRFHFYTTEMGTIRVMYDVGLVVGFLPVIYLNYKGAKRPTWIGISCLLMGIGAMTCAVPHFFMNIYNTRGWELGKVQPRCDRSDFTTFKSDRPTNATDSVQYNAFGFDRQSFGADFNASIDTGDLVTSPWSSLKTAATNQDTSASTTTRAMTEQALVQAAQFNTENGADGTSAPSSNSKCKPEKLRGWKYVFMLGVFLNGLGGAAYFTLGIAFLDESVSPKQSVLYTALLNSALLLGIGVGLAVNAKTLRSVYVDVNWGIAGPHGMSSDNPRWRGAWWLGMIIVAGMCGLASLPIFGFPKQLPGAMKAHLQDIMTSDIRSPQEKRSPTTQSPSIWKSVKGCLTNVTYLGLTLEQILTWVIITSFSAFMPSYMRAIYGLGGKTAGFMAGTVILFALIGTITGSFIQYRFNLSVLGNLRFSLASAIAFLVFLGGIFVDCSKGEFAGWTTTYPVRDSFEGKPQSFANCNMNCTSKCSWNDFEGFCYVGAHPAKPNAEKVFMYYSPCFAGCTYANTSGGYNCSCVPKDGFEGGGDIRADLCGSQVCVDRASAAIILFCWCAILLFARMNPLQHTLLRCIPFKDRVVGLTMSGLLARMLGSIPTSPFLGYMLHQACVIRNEICGEVADCQWRKESMITSKVALVLYSASVIGVIGLVLAYWDQSLKNKKMKKIMLLRTKESRQKDKRRQLPIETTKDDPTDKRLSDDDVSDSG